MNERLARAVLDWPLVTMKAQSWDVTDLSTLTQPTVPTMLVYIYFPDRLAPHSQIQIQN